MARAYRKRSKRASPNRSDFVDKADVLSIRRVKRWRGGDMRLRWTAAGLLMAEKQFRRIRGCRLMPRLMAVLDKKMDPVECPSEAA